VSDGDWSAAGWADNVRNRRDGEVYSVSTLKSDSLDLNFDFYETVVWQAKGPFDEPNEDNALLVVNTGQKLPWWFKWVQGRDLDLAATRHKEIVKVVESQPTKNWVRKYKSIPLASPQASRLLKAAANGEGPQLADPLGRGLVILGNRLLREVQ